MATTVQFAEEFTAINPNEAARLQTMARFFFASFWCIVFTGAVRKWLFPHVSIFYLFQDVPIALAYLYALKSGVYTRGYIFLTTLLLAVVLTLQGLMQIMSIGLSLIVAGIGLHHYLFYLPMLLIFPLCLTVKYRRNFIRWNLWLSLPMGVLVLVQASSSTMAWVNHTSEGDTMGLPGVDIPRVTGTFNFGVFFGIWLGMALALCLGEWLLRPDRRVLRNNWVLLASTFSIALCALVSGSRQNILLCVASVAGAFVAAVILRSNRAILAIGGICVLLPIAIGATYVASPTEFTLVQDRLLGKRGSTDLQNRVVGAFTAFLTEPKFSLIGAGIGMGVDAAHVGNSESYNFTYALSEQDTARNVMELGSPVGLFYVFIRLSFAFGIVVLSLNLLLRRNSPHVVPLSMILLAQNLTDLTRAATMTSSQVMIGYAFILGVQMYPDSHEHDL